MGLATGGAGRSGTLTSVGTRRTTMNLRTASRHSQDWNRAGIEGMSRQIDQTTSTTRPPCQEARHIVVAQASRRMFMIDDRPFAADFVFSTGSIACFSSVSQLF